MELRRSWVTVCHVFAVVLAIWITGGTPAAGESQISEPLYPQTVEVMIRSSAPIDLIWEAHVQMDGGYFRLFSGQQKEMRLLGEVEARSGQQSYRFQHTSSSGITAHGLLRRFELHFITEGGNEVSLASIIVIEENVAPATTVEVYSPQSLATLGSSTSQQEHQERMPNVRRRTLSDRGSRCPPTPPP